MYVGFWAEGQELCFMRLHLQDTVQSLAYDWGALD